MIRPAIIPPPIKQYTNMSFPICAKPKTKLRKRSTQADAAMTNVVT